MEVMKGNAIDRYSRIVAAVVGTFTVVVGLWQIVSWLLANTPTSIVQPIISILLLAAGAVMTLLTVWTFRKSEFAGFLFFIVSFVVYAAWYYYEAATNERFAIVIFVLFANVLFFALSVAYVLKAFTMGTASRE